MLKLGRVLTLLALGGGLFASNVSAETIDFFDVQPGTILSNVFGDGGSGPIGVFGLNPDFPPNINAAVVFDSSAPTGSDVDLGTPHTDFGGPGVGLGGRSVSAFPNDTSLGNILIVAEDLIDENNDDLVDDPDDANLVGARLSFDFSAVAPATIHGITIIDVEAVEPGATLQLFDQLDNLLTTVILPPVGDNGVAHLVFGPVDGVYRMDINLNGSAAIDNILFTPVPEPATAGLLIIGGLLCVSRRRSAR